MNHREPPHLPVGTRRALHCLSLLLLPAISPRAALSLPRARPPTDLPARPAGREPVPYLPVLCAPPLRFERPAPPPDLTQPAAAAPPIPPLTLTESSVAQANAAAAQSAAGTLPTGFSLPPVVPTSSPAPAKAAPAPILRDDARPAIRNEDFLPFFQIPGTARAPGDVNLIVPAAITAPAGVALPPSAATYTQTPK